MENDYVNDLSLFNESKEEAVAQKKIDIKILIIGALFGSVLTFIITVTLLYIGVNNSEWGKMYVKQNEIQNCIEQYYLYDEEVKTISDSVCAAMVNALKDDYSMYYTEEQYYNIMNRFDETDTMDYYMLEGTTYGYLKIHSFSNQSVEEFKKALLWLQEMNAEAFVIDLRGNSGGIIESTIGCLDCLLPEQEILKVIYANNREEIISSDETGFVLPCVVLIDETTISAAEVFAGVLKKSGYACLMGRSTYGKGVMQKYVPLRDNSALRLTYAEYVFCDGTKNNFGITPNQPVEKMDNIIDSAINYLKMRSK